MRRIAISCLFVVAQAFPVAAQVITSDVKATTSTSDGALIGCNLEYRAAFTDQVHNPGRIAFVFGSASAVNYHGKIGILFKIMGRDLVDTKTVRPFPIASGRLLAFGMAQLPNSVIPCEDPTGSCLVYGSSELALWASEVTVTGRIAVSYNRVAGGIDQTVTIQAETSQTLLFGMCLDRLLGR